MGGDLDGKSYRNQISYIAIKADEKQLFLQAYGMISSLMALGMEKSLRPDNIEKTLLGSLIALNQLAPAYGNQRTGNLVFFNKATNNKFNHRPKLMKSLCKRAGIDPPFGFHAIRHFIASYLADSEKVSKKRYQEYWATNHFKQLKYAFIALIIH